MQKSNAIKVVLVIIYAFSSFVFGAYVSEESALEVARGIYVENKNLHTGDEFSMSRVEVIRNEGNDLIYIFHLNPTGFIMVPADNQAVPNLAFGFEHSFETENMPFNISALLNRYKTEMSVFIDNSVNPSDQIMEQWDYYLSGEVQPRSTRDVSPLLDAEFDQGGSWNNAIHAEIGFNGPVGCVAVSMCQVMHYWGYPEQGIGSNFYTEDDFGFIQVDFEDAFYDFDNMAATVATAPSQLLLFHAGVSVNMDYEWDGSGAWVVGGYPSAFYAMENFFAYSSDIVYYWKDNFTTNEYRDIIKNELDYNRPVITQGYDNGGYGGHAWNIDGYAGNNLHCNWGWGGSSNGFFNLTTMGGFPNDQAVITKIIPATYTAPIALYEYDVNGLTVSFQDLSGAINDLEIESWSWNFGDGNTSFVDSPTHIYGQEGVYEISLVVVDIFGQASEPHIETIDLMSIIPGDVNLDEIINILDIVMLVNFVLGSDSPSSSEFLTADLNSDGILNILDIVNLTNLILGA